MFPLYSSNGYDKKGVLMHCLLSSRPVTCSCSKPEDTRHGVVMNGFARVAAAIMGSVVFTCIMISSAHAFVGLPAAAVPCKPLSVDSQRSLSLPLVTVNATPAALAIARRYQSRRTNVVAHCSSPPNPFESTEDNDPVRREAEELEQMIRGKRGISVEAIEREWRKELLRTMETEGTRLCAEAYEGFKMRGRGALFVSMECLITSQHCRSTCSS